MNNPDQPTAPQLRFSALASQENAATNSSAGQPATAPNKKQKRAPTHSTFTFIWTRGGDDEAALEPGALAQTKHRLILRYLLMVRNDGAGVVEGMLQLYCPRTLVWAKAQFDRGGVTFEPLRKNSEKRAHRDQLLEKCSEAGPWRLVTEQGDFMVQGRRNDLLFSIDALAEPARQNGGAEAEPDTNPFLQYRYPGDGGDGGSVPTRAEAAGRPPARDAADNPFTPSPTVPAPDLGNAGGRQSPPAPGRLVAPRPAPTPPGTNAVASNPEKEYASEDDCWLDEGFLSDIEKTVQAAEEKCKAAGGQENQEKNLPGSHL